MGVAEKQVDINVLEHERDDWTSLMCTQQQTD